MALFLLDKIKKSRDKKDSLTLIQCFGQMARTVGNKIAHFLPEIYPLLENFVKALDDNNSHDLDNEIVESCFSTFETLIKKCPKEVGPFAQKMLELCMTKLSYDPNFSYGDDDAQMEDEEDNGGWGSDISFEGGNEDDGDTSWKVRRSAIKVIDAIITSRNELLRLIYHTYAW